MGWYSMLFDTTQLLINYSSSTLDSHLKYFELNLPMPQLESICFGLISNAFSKYLIAS